MYIVHVTLYKFVYNDFLETRIFRKLILFYYNVLQYIQN